MLGQLIKKEILEHLMDLRFAIACVLCLIVVLSSLFVRGRDYSQVLSDYHEESAMERHRLDTMRTPWRFSRRGVNVHRRPNPLKIFVRGVDNSNGGTVKVASNTQLQPIMRPLQNTAVHLFPSIDLVPFVGLIMSLMAIVFGYDAICGEKQRGTLRLMLSYSVPRHLVLLSKWIGGYVTLILPFVLTVIAGAVIVLTQRDIALGGSQRVRLLAIVGLAMLYIAVVYSLAMYVSTLTARASTSAMVLLSVWVILILAIPNLSPHIAQVLRPSANAQEVESVRRTASREIWDRCVTQEMKAYDKANGFPDKWWEAINWNDWESKKKAFFRWCHEWKVTKEGSLARLNEYSKIDQRYGREMDAQIELSRWIGRISPFTCFAMAATELADAGLMENQRYEDQLRTYQTTLCAYAHDEGLAMTKVELANEGQLPEPWYKLRVKPVPVFNYVPPAAREYLQTMAVDGGILAGMAVLLFMLSYVSFLRYDVR